MGTLRNFRRLERERILRRFNKQKRRNLLAEPGIHEFSIILDNLKESFNVGKIFRSGDAFGVSGIHLIGTEYFDPGPAKGSFKWVPATFYKSFSECYEKLIAKGHEFFVLEPEEGHLLGDVYLPKKSAFIFGHEEFGISFSKEDFPDIKGLTIPQFGRVQSLNVSVAASIVMYEYIRQHGEEKSITKCTGGRGNTTLT